MNRALRGRFSGPEADLADHPISCVRLKGEGERLAELGIVASFERHFDADGGKRDRIGSYGGDDEGFAFSERFVGGDAAVQDDRLAVFDRFVFLVEGHLAVRERNPGRGVFG